MARRLLRAPCRAHGAPCKQQGKGMDIWYELALREMGDLNQEVTAMLKDAERALLVPSADEPDEDDE